MGLEAIAAAAEVAALADKERTPTFTFTPTRNSSQQRSGSTLSDSTVGDNEAFESDSSALATPSSRTPPLKKRRSSTSDTPSKHSKQKMSDEVENFPAEMLLDLAGSTSAEVRRMNENERALVHYKRRLRNRESAKRSRARRQATISDIQSELEDLRQLTASLVDRCMDFAKVNEKQGLELETLRKEKLLLESLLRGSAESA